MSGGISGIGRKPLRVLLKQGWNEIPEIIGSTGLAFVGLALGTYACYRYKKNNGDNRRYKATYVIMRPDDPRVALVHKD